MNTMGQGKRRQLRDGPGLLDRLYCSQLASVCMWRNFRRALPEAATLVWSGELSIDAKGLPAGAVPKRLASPAIAFSLLLISVFFFSAPAESSNLPFGRAIASYFNAQRGISES